MARKGRDGSRWGYAAAVAFVFVVIGSFVALATLAGQKQYEPKEAKSGVFGVEKGMTRAQVLHAAGQPDERGGPYGTDCWFYRATTKDAPSIVGRTFCFRGGRVTKVQTAVHL